MSNDITIKVGVNSTVKRDLSAATSDVKTSMSGIKSALGMIGVGFGFGAIIGGIKSLINSMGELQDAADQLDIGTTEYQKLSIVAGESGIKAQQLSTIMQKLAAVQADIGNNKSAQEAFKALGISIEEVISAKPDRMLELIAKGLNETGNKAAVFDLLGAKAGKLIPLLQEMKDGISGINREGIISESDLEKADKLGEKIESIGRTLKSWTVDLFSGIVKRIEFFATSMGVLSAGGNMQEANDIFNKSESSFSSKKAQKEADEKMMAEKKVSEYRKKLAEEDAAWIADIDKKVAEKQQSDFSAFIEDGSRKAAEAEENRTKQKRKNLEDEKNILAKIIENEKFGAEKAAEKMQKRLAFLREVGAANIAAGEAGAKIARNPKLWRERDRAEKDEKKQKERDDKRAAEIEKMIAVGGKGFKLPARLEQFMDARNAAAMGADALRIAEVEERNFKREQKAAMKAMINMDIEMQKITAKLDAVAKG